ncbi:unnamed protein product, partial [Allacma fusca]
MMKSRAKRAVLIGDDRQIKYINRSPLRKTQYQLIPNQLIDEKEHLSTSYRCTLTTAKLLTDLYDGGMYSTSVVHSEMEIFDYYSVDTIPRVSGAQYLVFTQHEKAILENRKFKVNTIHEYQGKQNDHVIIVRLNKQRNPVYESLSHVIVALSRHRKKLDYHTVDSKDLLSSFIHRTSNFTIHDYRSVRKGDGEIPWKNHNEHTLDYRNSNINYILNITQKGAQNDQSVLSQLNRTEVEIKTTVVSVGIGKGSYPAQLDTGATPNVISEETAKYLMENHSEDMDYIPLSEPVSCVLANEQIVETAHYALVPTIRFGKHTLKIPFYVMKNCNQVFLIGMQTMIQLGIDPRIHEGVAYCQPTPKHDIDSIPFLKPEEYVTKLKLNHVSIQQSYLPDTYMLLNRANTLRKYYKLPEGVTDTGPE